MAGVLNRSKSKCYQIAKRWRSDSYGHEKGPSNDDPSVIPAGFEPTTDSLEGCCSIQLSYETVCRAEGGGLCAAACSAAIRPGGASRIVSGPLCASAALPGAFRRCRRRLPSRSPRCSRRCSPFVFLRPLDAPPPKRYASEVCGWRLRSRQACSSRGRTGLVRNPLQPASSAMRRSESKA